MASRLRWGSCAPLEARAHREGRRRRAGRSLARMASALEQRCGDASGPCRVAREAGNAAVAAGDYAAAEAHYTAALQAHARSSWEAQGEDVTWAALFCNRAQARLQLGRPAEAAADASSALARLPSVDTPDAAARQLRVKALYRRAMAREALGEACEALLDINLVLKLTPGSQAVLAAAKRLKEAAPSPPREPRSPGWVPEHPYNTRSVLQIACGEAFVGSIRGHTPVDSNPVVKFRCGLGVAAYHGHGGLCAIWPLGAPKLLPRFRECPQTGKVLPIGGPPDLGDDYFELPNMRPADGLHIFYSRGGDLRRILCYRDGKLDGLALRFETDGSLRLELGFPRGLTAAVWWPGVPLWRAQAPRCQFYRL